MNGPNTSNNSTRSHPSNLPSPGPVKSAQSTPHSMRSRRTATWARPKSFDDSSDSVTKTAPTDFRKMGQRIFVFIIGGATRSELRVCHKLTSKLRREVVLGTTSLDDPPQYITKLKLLSERELSMENISF